MFDLFSLTNWAVFELANGAGCGWEIRENRIKDCFQSKSELKYILI